jgi:hypothetical protein
MSVRTKPGGPTRGRHAHRSSPGIRRNTSRLRPCQIDSPCRNARPTVVLCRSEGFECKTLIRLEIAGPGMYGTSEMAMRLHGWRQRRPFLKRADSSRVGGAKPGSGEILSAGLPREGTQPVSGIVRDSVNVEGSIMGRWAARPAGSRMSSRSAFLGAARGAASPSRSPRRTSVVGYAGGGMYRKLPSPPIVRSRT